MDSSFKLVSEAVTHSQMESAQLSRSTLSESRMRSKNGDRSVLCSRLNFWSSASIVKSGKSVLRNANSNQLPYSSPGGKIRQRKFVIAKKKSPREIRIETDYSEARVFGEGNINGDDSVCKNVGEISELGLKRGRDRFLEDVEWSIPEHGSGRVRYLVKAFEKLSIKKTGDLEIEDDNKGITLGLQQTAMVSNGDASSCSSLCPSDLFLTSESLGLGSSQCCSTFGSQGRISIVNGGRKSMPRSTKSHGTLNRRKSIGKQQKTASPFMMRTEFLSKPPVKQNTKPIDMVLHTDTRAMERAEFNHQVAIKMNIMEQHQREKAKQQKLDEEEEIRRLRKELVPKAQPMPYFDRPFIPRRSTKQPTIPREPKFHLPQHKKIKY